jgi:hypothetical protein
MAGMKFEALLAARVAEARVEVDAEIRALIDAIDAEMDPLVEQVFKLDARVSKLEGSVSPQASD